MDKYYYVSGGQKSKYKYLKQIFYLIIIFLILFWSAKGTDLNFSNLKSGFNGMKDVLNRMLPPDFSVFTKMLQPTIETIQIAIWGTLIAILFSLPLGFLAARNTTPQSTVYTIIRIILNTIRAIPETVFALIFVAAVGLGPFPGVLAIGVSSSGMLGKFLGDAIENIDPGPVEALIATGANKVQTIFYAIIPQIIPEFVTLALFRFEMNLRASTVIGIVGAGGLGFELTTSMRLFKYHETSLILLIILVIVTIVDFISNCIRKKII